MRFYEALQNWVLHTILNNIPVGNHAHGFVKERSILTNAAPHVGKDIVINIDLKDFFPSIDYKRVKGLFHSLGYSEQMSVIFALIYTQADTEVVEMDGVTYYVQSGKRFLPQGSPASPAISNLITYKLDRKIQGLSRKLDFTYTRYADDLSFSTSIANEDNVSRLLCFLRKIILSEGLTIHPDKTHIMRKGGQQKVTGIVVNEKLNVERNQLRKFRALLHNIEQNGWKGQQWGQTDNLINSIEGYISFIRMVNRERAEKFRIQLGKVVEKHGYPQGEDKACVPATPKATLEKTEATPTFEAQQKISTDTLPDDTEKKKDEDKNSEWWNIL